MKKKVLALLLTPLLALGLTACGSSTGETENVETESPHGKTLIVYYSATGNTKHVANMISEKTNGDVFELEPVKPYTGEELDWTNDDSRVSEEHNDEGKREVELVSSNIPEWDTYDTVYIGYPIWWGIAAWPVDGFIKANDFTGKTVIPFATAASSGIGKSGELLEEMAGTGTWLKGECLRGNVSQEDVNKWIDSF